MQPGKTLFLLQWLQKHRLFPRRPKKPSKIFLSKKNLFKFKRRKIN
jgi:hypothetical protein